MTGTVTGYTLEKIQSIVDASVTNAFITSSGNLILETEDETQINAGPILGEIPTVRESIVSIGSVDFPARDAIVPDWNVGGYNEYMTTDFWHFRGNYDSFFDNRVTGISWNPAANALNLIKYGTSTTTRTVDMYKYIEGRYREFGDYTAGAAANAPNGVMAWSPDGTYLASSSGAAPRLVVYKRSSIYPGVTKLTDPAVLPGGNVRGISWSPNGLYLAVSYDVSPFVKIYARVGDVFTDLGSGAFAVAPPAAGWRCDFSPNGKYLAICYNGLSPVVYKRSGTTAAPVFTALTLPGSISAITPQDISWSPNGQYLAFVHYGTNGEVVILKRTGDTFAKVTGLGKIATNCLTLDWSPDGRYLAYADFAASAKFKVYRFQKDAFEDVPDVLVTPSGNVLDLKFSPDGLYLTLAEDATPYVMAYKTEGGAINKAVIPILVKS